MKGSMHQENTRIVNVCTPNIGAPRYIKQIREELNKERKKEI